MRYDIKGGTFPVVVCQLENGEKMITEKGSMVWMCPWLELRSLGGGVGYMVSMAFSGDSMIQII